MVYGTPQECYDLMSELAHSWTKKCDEEIIQITRSIASQRRMR